MFAAVSSSALLRLSAPDTNATCRPLPEIAGEEEASVPGAPSPSARLTRVVWFAWR
jgi:hypothetical protein